MVWKNSNIKMQRTKWITFKLYHCPRVWIYRFTLKFDRILSIFLTKIVRGDISTSFLVRLDRHKYQCLFVQVDVTVVIIMDRLGPDFFSTLWMKEQVLHRGYPVSVVQAGHHHAQQIDRQSALQTAEKENTDRIPFTLIFHPHNHTVQSIILIKL